MAEDGYSGGEVRVTPTRTEIIITATRTENALGEEGWRIWELTVVVQKRCSFPKFKMSFIVRLFKSIFCVTGFQKLVRMCLVVFPFVFYLTLASLTLLALCLCTYTSENLSAIIFVRLFLHPSVLFVESISFMLGQLLLS